MSAVECGQRQQVHHGEVHREHRGEVEDALERRAKASLGLGLLADLRDGRDDADRAAQIVHARRARKQHLQAQSHDADIVHRLVPAVLQAQKRRRLDDPAVGKAVGLILLPVFVSVDLPGERAVELFAVAQDGHVDRARVAKAHDERHIAL